MPTLPTVIAFAAASVALLLIPGPAVLYVLNHSVSDGHRVVLLSLFIHPDDGCVGTQALVLGLVFVSIECITDNTYSFVASTLRSALRHRRTLLFSRRYVAGTVYICLGLVAAAATGTRPAATSR